MSQNKTFSKNEKFIGKMFDDISSRYDMLNHVFTTGMDIKWRRDAVKYLKKSGRRINVIADIGCGTGDFGKALTSLKPETNLSLDLSFNMLGYNRSKLKSYKNFPIQSDVHYLPLKNDSTDLVTIGFGIRNFDNLEKSFGEIFRILNKNGLLTVIEMFKPEKKSITQKLFILYFRFVMAPIGNLIAGSRYAYSYLFESVNNFVTVDEFIKLAEGMGFKVIYKKNNFLKFIWTVVLEKGSVRY